MRRRDLLVAGAAVAIAGCSSDETTADPSEDEEDPEANSVVDDNETDPEPDTGGNESDDDQDDTADEEDAKAQQRKRVDEGIETAREHANSALETYASFGDGRTYADVGPTDTVDAPLVRRDLDEATAALDDVRDDALEDQQDTIAALDAGIQFVDLVLAVDAKWGDVLGAARAVHDEIFAESVSAIERERDTLSDALGVIDGRIGSLDDVDTELAIESGVVGSVTTDQKLTAFDEQRAAAGAMVDVADAYLAGSALPSWLQGVDEYVAGNYVDAWSTLYEGDLTGLGGPVPSDPAMLSDEYEALTTLAEGLPKAAEELEKSADYYRSGDNSKGNYRYDRAMQALNENEQTSTLQSRSDLEQASPPRM